MAEHLGKSRIEDRRKSRMSQPADAFPQQRLQATGLLVIDMQIGLLDGAYDEDGVLARVTDVLRGARAAGAPVVFVQHDHVSYEPLMPGRPTWKSPPAARASRRRAGRAQVSL